MTSDNSTQKLHPLFCKPIPVNYPSQLLYISHEQSINANISFRSLQLETDIELLHNWVNRSYTKRFWQLNGSKAVLYNTYYDLLKNPNAHSFIGCCNNMPVCQVDLYNVSADELKNHIEHKPDDCGLHLLMCPPEQMIKGLSLAMLRHFIQFYFSFPVAQCLYAEPDKENAFANNLAKRAGFMFLKEVHLSYKTANLYSITKQQFQKNDQ